MPLSALVQLKVTPTRAIAVLRASSLDCKVRAFHASSPGHTEHRGSKQALPRLRHVRCVLTGCGWGPFSAGLTPLLLQQGPGPAAPRAGGLPESAQV